MKPLSIFVAMTIVSLLCISFNSSKEQIIPKQQVAAVDNVHYYFYRMPGDSYDGLYTTSEETARLELLYDVFVDSNPFGGTLLARGYVVNNFPHTVWPSVYLYGHF